jgi:hypothetical protein
MWRVIARGLQTLAAHWLQPYWKAGLKRKKPSAFMETLGRLILVGCVVFAVYSLYTWASSGHVFRMISRRGWPGWITYADDPVGFVFWAGFYSLPLIIPPLVIFGQFAWRRKFRRAAFRQFTDGSSRPPPVVRR